MVIDGRHLHGLYKRLWVWQVFWAENSECGASECGWSQAKGSVSSGHFQTELGLEAFAGKSNSFNWTPSVTQERWTKQSSCLPQQQRWGKPGRQIWGAGLGRGGLGWDLSPSTSWRTVCELLNPRQSRPPPRKKTTMRTTFSMPRRTRTPWSLPHGREVSFCGTGLEVSVAAEGSTPTPVFPFAPSRSPGN